MAKDRSIALKMQQARAHLKNQHPKAAKILLSEVCRGVDNDAEAWRLLGLSNLQLGEHAEAANCLQRAAILRPQHAQTHYYLGKALQALGRLDEAEAASQTGLRTEPRDAPLNFQLATILHSRGDLEQAITGYLRSLDADSRNATAHYNLGLIYHGRGQLKEAELHFRNAVRIDPNYFKAHNNLGSLLMEMGQHAAATQCYRNALRLKPDSIDVLINLSVALRHAGQWEEAVSCGKQAVALAPDNLRALNRLGMLLTETGRLDEMLECYIKILEIDPDSVEAQYVLASRGLRPALQATPAEMVRSLFDGYAETFDQHLVGALRYQIPEHLHRAIVTVLGEESRPLSVIDLGCGTGLCGPLFRDMASRLVGVDLSPKMIDKARERRVYDELIVGDIILPMRAAQGDCDLVLSADVFVYVGDLTEVFHACAAALAAGGYFAFSLEAAEAGASYVLKPNQRYGHSLEYVRALAASVQMQEVMVEDVVLRMDDNKPINGHIVILRKP